MALKTKNPGTRPVVVAVIVAVLILIAAAVAIKQITTQERQRDLIVWQDRLGLVAESRLDAVNRWLAAQIKSVTDLAGNGTIQLFLSERAVAAGKSAEPPQQDPAEIAYLRDILTLAATRGGFETQLVTDTIAANVPDERITGLALLDTSGRTLISTRGMPPVFLELQKTILATLAEGTPGIYDVYLNARGQVSMAFLAPVHPIQGSAQAVPVGLVLGVKPVGAELFPLLEQKGLTTKTHETYLVRRDGELVIYLSRLADGTAPLKRALNITSSELAAAYALEHPGTFAIKRDYNGAMVLMTSRPVSKMPWVLVHKVNRDEVLAEADARQHRLIMVLALTVTLFMAALAAAWFHGSSLRYRQTAEALARSNQELNAQQEILSSVTNNVSAYIVIVSPEGVIRFANQAVGAAQGVPPPDLIGKSLASVFGPHTANTIETALKEDVDARFPRTIEIGAKERHCLINHTRLSDGARLLVLHDVSELLAARARHERMMWELLETLSGILEKHDPYSVDHSIKVEVVSQAMGEKMELNNRDLTALRIAANLINLGKITIPKEILTKPDKLNPAEMQLVRGHVDQAVAMLGRIEFEGPVIEAIGQSYEYLDGTGYPQGLKNAEIMPLARILGVANAFVALVNPRSWRDAKTFQQAIDILLQEADTKYNRLAVAVLFALVEGKTGKIWAQDWRREEA